MHWLDNGLSNKVCVPIKCVQHDYRNKWIKNISKARSCECKCRFDGGNCSPNQSLHFC